jgi:DNA helicase-2/ATP-dependent DNA helicase PcrA
MDFSDNLNPQQWQAVLHERGPLLVFAGAGSGKTRVITYRIAHLVRACSLQPWQILAVTFTNKAAGEMRTRVGDLLGESMRDTWIGTFHATCARLLRQFAEPAGLRSDFVIYDDSDQRAVVTRCIRDLHLDEKRFVPRAVQAKINQAKQDGTTADQYQPGNYFEDQIAKVYGQYERRMRAASALDFGDLLFRMVLLLDRKPEVREQLQRRYRHILVDEFQDTNHVQYRLLKQLTGPERNLCVVGDDDQSIYRWRGADVRNILDFQKDYSDAVVVTLGQNYRSTANILSSAEAVIKRNRTRAPKKLWTDNADGEPLHLVTLTDERAEAAYVARHIMEATETGRQPGDIAVFYRINAQARVIEESLRMANIPYRVIGGLKFYERAEVKDIVAYLKVIQNPDDDVDLIRIINRPARKIGTTTVNRLQELASQWDTSMFGALQRSLQAKQWPKATQRRLQSFFDLIEQLRAQAETAGPAELATTVLRRTGYLDSLEGQDTPEADARLENLHELVGSFEQFERENDDANLSLLLESISLQQDVDSMDGAAQTVTLMTVHSAKGLEFPLVFVTGMEEDIFPYRRTGEEVDTVERQERLEEERRLCYVAFTRAREELVLTNVVCRRLFGNERYNMHSRFVEDIPEERLEITKENSGGTNPPWAPTPMVRSAPATRPAPMPRPGNTMLVNAVGTQPTRGGTPPARRSLVSADSLEGLMGQGGTANQPRRARISSDAVASLAQNSLSGPGRPAAKAATATVARKPKFEAPAWAANLPLPGGSGGGQSIGGFGRGAAQGDTPKDDEGHLADEPRVVADPFEDDSATCDQSSWSEGVSVRHRVFGVGRVFRVEQGLNPKVIVDFVGHGRKTILARFLQHADY